MQSFIQEHSHVSTVFCWCVEVVYIYIYIIVLCLGSETIRESVRVVDEIFPCCGLRIVFWKDKLSFQPACTSS